MVITVRPWREHSELIDLPSQVIACGVAAGLIPAERCVALLARAADTELIARGSFFQRDFIRKQRAAGLPLHLITHEDVIVLRAPDDQDVVHQRSAAGAARPNSVHHECGMIGPGHWAA
ncbi:hypothetical protein [Amycolatopsis sp. NPDC001319]|uniref:hypothetical protein n=1 Tax=unclassified Amycolatopsis TaxID=2618356 RepID=UPI0036A622D0